MKTLEQIKAAYKSPTIDSRDLYRLAKFIPFEKFPFCDIALNDNVTKEEWDKKVIPFTRENVLKQLEEDVAFGFEKALDKRGISAGLMFDVVKMWNWVLEEGLENWSDDNYACYGLPLFKATAVKYEFDNPIGDDTGDEDYYNEVYDE